MPRGRRRRAEQPEPSRKQLMAAAIDCFARLGFQGTTIDRIAHWLAQSRNDEELLECTSRSRLASQKWKIPGLNHHHQMLNAVVFIKLGFFRDRGRATYIYTVQGQRYQTSNAILRNRRTRSLQRGQKAKIVANRENPKAAFLRDIYT